MNICPDDPSSFVYTTSIASAVDYDLPRIFDQILKPLVDEIDKLRHANEHVTDEIRELKFERDNLQEQIRGLEDRVSVLQEQVDAFDNATYFVNPSQYVIGHQSTISDGSSPPWRSDTPSVSDEK